jgi:hypothetical protein
MQVYIASGYFDMPGERKELHEKILPAISKKCVPLRIKVGSSAKKEHNRGQRGRARETGRREQAEGGRKDEGTVDWASISRSKNPDTSVKEFQGLGFLISRICILKDWDSPRAA